MSGLVSVAVLSKSQSHIDRGLSREPGDDGGMMSGLMMLKISNKR